MADILKYDVQTYVRKMIFEEFERCKNEYTAPSDDPEYINTRDYGHAAKTKREA